MWKGVYIFFCTKCLNQGYGVKEIIITRLKYYYNAISTAKPQGHTGGGSDMLTTASQLTRIE